MSVAKTNVLGRFVIGSPFVTNVAKGKAFSDGFASVLRIYATVWAYPQIGKDWRGRFATEIWARNLAGPSRFGNSVK